MNSGGSNISPLLFLQYKMIGDKAMEKITMFIHNTKDKLKNINNTEYRTVTFIGGNKNILDIIKELIKDKY